MYTKIQAQEYLCELRELLSNRAQGLLIICLPPRLTKPPRFPKTVSGFHPSRRIVPLNAFPEYPQF